MKYIAFILSVFIISCNSDQKFDKQKWTEKGDLQTYPYRKAMLNDLVANQKIVGLNYRQLIELIGDPENKIDKDSNALCYNITTDYGHDIDPVYLKNLKIKLTRDSIVESFKIEDWKK